MATLLLVVIYIAFIGLGIPDSLFGTAWPAIYQELDLPVSAANCVTILISGGTILASLLSAKLIQWLGTAKITAFSTLLTALALLGFSLSGNLLWMCLFALPLGVGAGAIDTALNNYVALYYKASHMNFLHCFYGVGVSLSPYLMSLTLSGQQGWRGGYRLMFFFQMGITLVTFLSFPLWKKVHFSAHTHSEVQAEAVPLKKLVKMPSVRLAWLIFFTSCGIEYTCGTWGSTFLVTAKNLSVKDAAQAIVLYYVGMTLGRFLSGLLSLKLSGWKLIYLGGGILLTAVLLLLAPFPAFCSVAGLFLFGLGNGPLFPNLIHLTPKNFGRNLSQSVMGSQMAAAYVGILSVPFLFGLLAQTVGVEIFSVYLLILFLLLCFAIFLLVKRLKKIGKYE